MKEARDLIKAIIEGVQEKKGTDIAVIDLSGMEGTVCRYFVVCQGGSPSQVDAIADSVEEMTRVKTAEKPVRVIGRENSIWVAMDYGDVMVHVFVPDARDYYDLDHLWEDAPVEHIANLDE